MKICSYTIFKVHSRKAHSIHSFVRDACIRFPSYAAWCDDTFYSSIHLRAGVCVCVCLSVYTKMSVFYAYVFDGVEWKYIKRDCHRHINLLTWTTINVHVVMQTNVFSAFYLCSFLRAHFFSIFIFKHTLMHMCVFQFEWSALHVNICGQNSSCHGWKWW